MHFADIHSHLLHGVDDGAASEAMSRRMLDAAYAAGTRLLCLTPHCHPGYFGDNSEKAALAFSRLQAYAAEKYPDLQLLPGNELRFSTGCLSWLENGTCRTLGSTDYVLVDFREMEKAETILGGLNRLLNAGYIPILAHAERYRNLPGEQIPRLRDKGVLIQVDAQALLMGFGLGQWQRSMRLLSKGMADFVSSDAHDLKSRPPQLERAWEYVKRKFGQTYARELFWNNAVRLLFAPAREDV